MHLHRNEAGQQPQKPLSDKDAIKVVVRNALPRANRHERRGKEKQLLKIYRGAKKEGI